MPSSFPYSLLHRSLRNPREREREISEDMQEIFGSVRKSLVFRPSSDGGGSGSAGGISEKIGSCLRKSRVGFGLGLGFLPRIPSGSMPPSKDDGPPIRWRKGELIGCGAFGQVYMGMNLDSGELLAVKQVVDLEFSVDLGFLIHSWLWSLFDLLFDLVGRF